FSTIGLPPVLIAPGTSAEIYRFQMDVSNANITTEGFYFLLDGSFAPTDFDANAFELLYSVGIEDIGSAGSLGFSGYDPGGPVPSGGIGWLFTENFSDGDQVFFYVVATVSPGAQSGNVFNIVLPDVDNFGIAGSNNKIDGGLDSGQPIAVDSGVSSTLTITSPNGGEQIEQNSTVAITWNESGIDDFEFLVIEYTATVDATEWFEIASGSASDFNGQALWFTNENSVLTGSDYKVRVRNSDESISDESDASFEIVPSVSPASITVVSPNGGEQIQQFSEFTIQFTTTGIPGSEILDFEFSSDNGSNWVYINSNTVEDLNGSFYWFVDDIYPVGFDNLIRITQNNAGSINDQSDATFEITPPPPPSVELIQPNGGETIEQNSTVGIYWNAQNFEGSEFVTIEYSSNGGAGYSTLATGNYEQFDGSYQWFVDDAVFSPLSTYRIRVTIDAASDESDGDFAIVPATSPESIVVLQPNAEAYVEQFQTYPILFNTTSISGTELLDIEYSDNAGGSWNPIAQNTVASFSGRYDWTPDGTYTPGFDYLIRVVKNSDMGIFGQSDGTFELAEGVIPAILDLQTVALSNGNVQAGSTNQLYYKLRMDVSQESATMIGLYATLSGTFEETDFLEGGF
ncbi:MAG: hypothetical protein RIF46_04350, partial [Cyclobacteriaceae bacterium]